MLPLPLVLDLVKTWALQPPTAPNAKRATEITVGGEKFWPFYLFQKAKK
jgi:hypothetical protein